MKLTKKQEIKSLPKYLFTISDDTICVKYKSSTNTIIKQDADGKYMLTNIDNIWRLYTIDELSELLNAATY